MPSLRANLIGELREISGQVNRMMAQEPEGRYPTAAAVAEAASRWTTQGPAEPLARWPVWRVSYQTLTLATSGSIGAQSVSTP